MRIERNVLLAVIVIVLFGMAETLKKLKSKDIMEPNGKEKLNKMHNKDITFWIGKNEEKDGEMRVEDVQQMFGKEKKNNGVSAADSMSLFGMSGSTTLNTKNDAMLFGKKDVEMTVTTDINKITFGETEKGRAMLADNVVTKIGKEAMISTIHAENTKTLSGKEEKLKTMKRTDDTRMLLQKENTSNMHDNKKEILSSKEKINKMLYEPGLFDDTFDDPTVPLSNGETMTIPDLQPGDFAYYELDGVPKNAFVTCTTSSSNGNLELVLFHNKYDFLGNLYCESADPTPTQVCTLGPSPSSDYFAGIRVYAVTSVSDATIMCTYNVGVLSNEQKLQFTNFQQDESMIYVFEYAPPVTSLTCVALSSGGDLDLHASNNYLEYHDEFEYHRDDDVVVYCESSGDTSNEDFCTVGPLTTKGTTTITVYAKTEISNAIMTCYGSYDGSHFLSNEKTVPIPELEREEYFIFVFKDIPAFTYFMCTTSGSKGYLSLNVSTKNDNDNYCVSNVFGTLNQNCTISPLVSDGTAIIKVFAYTEVSGATITCTWTYPELISLNNGEAVPIPDLLIHESATYAFKDLPGGALLTCTTSSSNGYLDLYVNWQFTPDYFHDNYYCRSTDPTSSQVCTLGPSPNDVHSDAYIYIDALTDVSDAIIMCSYNLNFLNDEWTVPISNLHQDEVIIYLFRYVRQAGYLTCFTFGSNGDLDLYVNSNNNGLYCQSTGDTSNETCTIGPLVAPYIANIQITAKTEVYDAAITCIYGSSNHLSNGETVSIPDLLESGNVLYYSLEGIPALTNLTCVTSGSSGDLDLYVSVNNKDFCSSATYNTSNEGCTVIPTSLNNTAVIKVAANTGFSNANLMCNFRDQPLSSVPVQSPTMRPTHKTKEPTSLICVKNKKKCKTAKEQCCARKMKCHGKNANELYCQSCAKKGDLCVRSRDCCKKPKSLTCIGGRCVRCASEGKRCSSDVSCCSGVCQNKKCVVV